VPFIARFEKCPANDDVFIAGTDNLWKNTSFFSTPGASWVANGPEMGAGISALAFAPSDATCLTYAFGTEDGQLRLTTNGGMTWSDIDAGNLVPNRWVTDLAFSPLDATTLYVTLSGFDRATPGSPGHLFRSTSALAAAPDWQKLNPTIDIPYDTIAIDPLDAQVVYVGTDIGLFRSRDGGTSWNAMRADTGLPDVEVTDIQIAPATGRVVAFTNGRGAFALTTNTTPPSLLTGKALKLVAAPSHPEKSSLSLASADPTITLGAGNGSDDDPTHAGASLRLFAGSGTGGGEDFFLPASGWSVIGTPGENRGYTYKDTTKGFVGPIMSVVLSSGKLLQARGKGSLLALPLANDPESVAIVLQTGSQRYCLSFGGTTAFKAGKSFSAKNANAPGTCPP